MGCPLPTPTTEKSKKSNSLSYASLDEKKSFSDYYSQSLMSQESYEIPVKLKVAPSSVSSRTSTQDRNFPIHPALEWIVRNDHGKVVPDIVEQIIAIRENYPKKSTDEVIEKYNALLAEHPMDLETEQSNTFEIFDESSFETMEIQKADIIRGYIWKHLTQLDSYKKNDFVSYKELCKRMPSELSVEWIDKDLPRIVPKHPYYSTKYRYGLNTLRRLLETLSVHNEDLEYFNSIGFIAAILLLYLKEEDTFWMINYLLDSSIIQKWICQDKASFTMTAYTLQKLMQKVLPEIYESTVKVRLNPVLYATTWFMTLFCSRFKQDVSVKVLDHLFKEGYTSIFKMALWVIKVKFEAIECPCFEDIILAFSHNLQ